MATTSSPLLLRQPGTGEFIVGKLWQEFVSPEPSTPAVSTRCAVADSNHEIAIAAGAMLLSDDFWSPATVPRWVKPPVDLVIGSLRQFPLLGGGSSAVRHHPAPAWSGPARTAECERVARVARLGSIPPRCLFARGFPTGCSRADDARQRWRLPDNMAAQDVVTQPTAALIDRDMTGERRQRRRGPAARGGRLIGCHRSASTKPAARCISSPPKRGSY